MMREIKFRAWSRTFNEYLPDDDYVNVWVNQSGLISYDDGIATESNLKLEVEQYTGLKDTNGKEIYEGDIVNYNHYSRGSVISWNQEHAAYGMNDSGESFISIHDTVLKDYDVVGNIHENPELLEEE